MSKLLDRLRNAVVQGAALASAAGAAGCYDSEGGPGGDGDGAGTSSVTAGRDTPVVPSAGSIARGGSPGLRGGSYAPSAGSRAPGGGSFAPTPQWDAAVPLPPFPLDRLGCFGDEFDGGYYGQCCVRAMCEVPQANGACGAKPSRGLPGGSGTCGCTPFAGFELDGVEGPFAPNAAYAGLPATSDARCCYLVASITCTGRPLIVGGVFVVAPIALRADWAAFA